MKQDGMDVQLHQDLELWPTMKNWPIESEE